MTTREWFRVMRAADWARDSGALLDIIDIITPAGFHDDKNLRLPVPPTEHHSTGGKYGCGYGVYTFWRTWQPVEDAKWRAGALLRHMERLLHPRLVNHIHQALRDINS